MNTRRYLLLGTVLGCGLSVTGRSQTAQSADYRLTSAAPANGGGGTATSAGYTLRTASLEGTNAGVAASTDYKASVGWVAQITSGCPLFEAWKAVKLAGNPQNGPLDDPDLDGIANLLEFALDTNPLSGAAGNPFVVTSSGASSLISFQRAAACLTYSIEISSSLAPNSWQPVSAPVSVSVTPAAGGMEAVVVTMPQSTGPRQFIRLRATIP